MKTFSINIAVVFSLMSSLLLAQEIIPQSETQQPNILIILADDMGWGDLGCTGSEVLKTPNIDRLAENGILFTSAYVTGSVCAP